MKNITGDSTTPLSHPDIRIPRAPLGFFPTPLTPLINLSRILGVEIFIKRDDLTGLALGGNKIRKLEYLLGDALAQGCDCVVTAGAAQSNHCRQTAAAAAQLNLDCHLVLGGVEPEASNGNLLLDRLFGSSIHWAGRHRKGEDIPALEKRLRTAGKTPYIVPYGGSNELGALGFVNATRELLEQSRDSAFTHIVFASSSGGTQAGLMLGKRLYQQNYQLIGIRIDKEDNQAIPFGEQIIRLANRTAELLKLEDRVVEQDLTLKSDFLGAGYGVVGEREREAIELSARSEGILLDPVYTGRAMGGLMAMIRSGEIGPQSRVLFWHTGGIPSLFAYADQLDDR